MNEEPLSGNNPDSPASEAWPDAGLAPIAPVSAPKQNGFFFGRFGMRAGWGIGIWLIFFLILTVLGQIFAVAVTGHAKEIMAARAQAQADPHGPKPHVHIDFVPALVIAGDGITFFGLLLVCWFFSRAERRPLHSYGIGGRRWKDVFPGAFWGLAMMSLLIATLRGLHLLVFDGRNLFGIAIVLYGLKWLLAFTLVGFSEEYTFRGYFQYTLMRGVWGLAERVTKTRTAMAAFWIAATMMSLLFALAHTGNGGENFFGLLQVFLAGITFSYALWRTGSLWWAIGFHATWDWAQSFLFGVADSGNISVGRLFITHPTGKPLLSGGADGPEGSIFATVALLLTLVVIRFIPSAPPPTPEQMPRLESLPPETVPATA